MKVVPGPARQRADQPGLVQPGLPGDARCRRAGRQAAGARRRPDPHGDRPRRVGDGRDDEEPGERHEGLHRRQRGHARRDRRRAGGDGLHRQRRHPRRRARRGPAARPRAAAIPRRCSTGSARWDMATRGSTIRLHACCGAAHWSMDALQQIVRRRPVDRRRRSSPSRSRSPTSSPTWCRIHAPADRARGEVQPRVRRGRHRPRRARRHPPVHRRGGAATRGAAR